MTNDEYTKKGRHSLPYESGAELTLEEEQLISKRLED
jgi:hypothetical protein